MGWRTKLSTAQYHKSTLRTFRAGLEEINETKWEEDRKVKFSMLSEKDIPELTNFVQEFYFPDEPISRNTNVMVGDGLIDSVLRDRTTKYLVDNPLFKIEIAPVSIVARSTDDDSILACKIGKIVSRSNDEYLCSALDECWNGLVPIWILGIPSWIPMPKKLFSMLNSIKLVQDLNYGKNAAFEDLEDAERIEFSQCICVASKARGLGLGSELIKRGLAIAKEHGCQYTYQMATNIYSQNIMHACENGSILHEVKYEDYKFDKGGREFMADPRENKVLQVISIKL